MGKVNNKKLKRRKRPTATNPLSILNSVDIDLNENSQEKITDALPIIEKVFKIVYLKFLFYSFELKKNK